MTNAPAGSRSRVAAGGRSAAPASLSVVVCARNEAGSIGDTLRGLRAAAAGCEVIVSIGDSTDDTAVEAARHGATVIGGEAGRGPQLRAGAQAATGDAIVLLHADTLLPEGFDHHVRQTLARPGTVAGAFDLRIDDPRPALRLIERLVRWRSRRRQLPYGDQAIFLTAEMLRRVGGVPALPAMEDYELVRRLRRHGRIEIAPAAVVTSARRWQRGGVWRTTAMNLWCVVAYRAGIAPRRIARWRERRRG